MRAPIMRHVWFYFFGLAFFRLRYPSNQRSYKAEPKHCSLCTSSNMFFFFGGGGLGGGGGGV